MWIIQSNFLDTNQITPLVEALNEFNVPFKDVSVIPFSDEFVTPLELDHKNVIPYGSTKLCKIAEMQGWTGLFFNRDTFNVSRWNIERDYDMLNNDAEIMTVRESMSSFNDADYPDEEPWFIRPLEDLKQFNGTVTTAKEIRRWMSSVDSGNFSFDENTLVAISSVKDIKMEWRYFVVDRKIVTGSSYRRMGQRLTSRELDPEVLAEAQSFADGWLPHETCVMDMALTDRGLKIIEFNCLNASGFYYHDIKAFAREVTKYFVDKYPA